MHKVAHEALVEELKKPEALKAYMAECESYKVGFTARMLGALLVNTGNLVYGRRPSYEKFKAVEVIARIPYQSWESVAYTWLTAYFGDELKALRLSRILPFARHAQDNETMHVVVMSQIVHKYGKNGFIRHTFIPIAFSFFYYWVIWLLSFFDRRVAFELNYEFEDHAYHQYKQFLEENGDVLKTRPVVSAFLKYYGREAANEYELFESIMIDEVIHRCESIKMAEELIHGRLS